MAAGIGTFDSGTEQKSSLMPEPLGNSEGSSPAGGHKETNAPVAALHGRRHPRKNSREQDRPGSGAISTVGIFGEKTPATLGGWTALASLGAAAAAALAYEIRLQKRLTSPPHVYGQCREGPLQEIYNEMMDSHDSILTRPMQPSLFVGTRGLVSSTAAYLVGGPHQKEHVRFREEMRMSPDGATISLDWELPVLDTLKNAAQRQCDIRFGPIDRPVVLIIHGLNNHSNFGYIRSMARACTERGWISASMNMRGCGGVKFTTPRGYNGAYTGDIRCIVQNLSPRLGGDGDIKNKNSTIQPLFLVGNSLSASLVTKYLGEEGLSGTLPDCVCGGAALGNPLVLKSTNMDMFFSPLLALGAKKTIMENFSTLVKMNDSYSRAVIRRALMAVTLAEFEEAIASLCARNDPIYPFAFRIGFKDAASYWNDGSSYRLIRFIPVPLLQLIASDDFLVADGFKGKLAYSLANPNVLIVETMCGGHLGWQESLEGGGGIGTSWANVATTDFIDAVLKTWHLRKIKTKTDTDAYFVEDESQREFNTLRPRL
jgi:predicted alpha/beta-fold hydrolase